MSKTLEQAIRTTRYHLRDRNPQSEAFTEPEYIMALQSAVRILAGELLLGESWVTGFLTLVAGTSEYTAPGTQDYDSIRLLRTQNDGLDIQIVSEKVFQAYRQGDTNSVSNRSTPQMACIRESATQVLTVSFFPTPDDSDTVDALRSLLPASFFLGYSGQIGQLPLDTLIPFDDQGFEALCYRVALEFYSRMTSERKTRAQLSDTTAQLWSGSITSLIKQSRIRRRRQQTDMMIPHSRRW